MSLTVSGIQIDPQELAVSMKAIREVVNTMTVMGINVGGYVTDDQCKRVAASVIVAIETSRAVKAKSTHVTLTAADVTAPSPHLKA